MDTIQQNHLRIVRAKQLNVGDLYVYRMSRHAVVGHDDWRGLLLRQAAEILKSQDSALKVDEVKQISSSKIAITVSFLGKFKSQDPLSTTADIDDYCVIVEKGKPR